MMDSLNIISWNVRGLGGRHCCKVRSVFRRRLRKSLIGRIDVLFIQEHHLNPEIWKLVVRPVETVLGVCNW